jgi:PhnB protein
MKKKKFSNPAPKGHSVVSPYLVIKDVEKVLEFLRKVFDAEIIEDLRWPDGSIMHGEARIGDTVIMVGMAREEYPPRPGMIHVYTANVDDTYQRALGAGASSLMEPQDQFYGHREAGVEDEQGNQWWMGQQIEELTQAEMEKRLADRANT